MPAPNSLTDSERRHNAAQALTSSREGMIRAAKELDAMTQTDATTQALHEIRLAITTLDDALAGLVKVELAFGSETLTRLDDNPSEYVDAQDDR